MSPSDQSRPVRRPRATRGAPAQAGPAQGGSAQAGSTEGGSAQAGSTRGGATRGGAARVPEATVARLAVYLRALAALGDAGVETVSSESLARAAGVNSAKVRKDLSHLGSYGTRGVGYHVEVLVRQISLELGITEHRSVVLVGAGNLGHALAGYGGFSSRGFRIAGLLDADPRRVGELVAGLRVRHVDELEELVAREGVSIGVIATPVGAAQEVCDRLVAAGVTAILNFAPVLLVTPAGVDLRKVDLSAELQILSFHEARKAAAAAGRHLPGLTTSEVSA